MAGITYYWAAALGNSGWQELPVVGSPRPTARDWIHEFGRAWSNQRTPTFVLAAKEGMIGAYVDGLSTGTSDHAGRPTSARLIAVAPQEQADVLVSEALSYFLSARAPALIRQDGDGVVALAADWQRPAPTCASGSTPPARFAKAVPGLRKAGRYPQGSLALYSDWLDATSAAAASSFRLVAGPEYGPAAPPKDPGEQLQLPAEQSPEPEHPLPLPAKVAIWAAAVAAAGVGIDQLLH